jgi:hypothetical protein
MIRSRIFVSAPYSNEGNILLLRLRIQSPYVYRFILGFSSVTTNSLRRRNMSFGGFGQQISQYGDQIHWVDLDKGAPRYGRGDGWRKDAWMRNRLMREARALGARDNDFVACADLDEILTGEAFREIFANPPTDYVNFEVPFLAWHFGSYFGRWGPALPVARVGALRRLRASCMSLRFGSGRTPRRKVFGEREGRWGFHLTYGFRTVAQTIDKLTGFAHTELSGGVLSTHPALLRERRVASFSMTARRGPFCPGTAQKGGRK